MDPARKRKIRLVVALTAALCLATALVYTSFSASSPAKTPGELRADADSGRTYKLTGRVADGTLVQEQGGMTFRVRDRAGTASVPVSYKGAVPDPFREGREIIVSVKRDNAGTFVGEPGSLVTKCPSKFTTTNPSGKAPQDS